MSRPAAAILGAMVLVLVFASSSFAQRGRGGGGSVHSGAAGSMGGTAGGSRGGGSGWRGGGDSRGGGGWRGGDSRGGGWRGGDRGWHGGHGRGSEVFVGVGPGWWDPYPYWSYPWPYYGGYAYGYGAPYYGGSYAPPVVEADPPVYVEQGAGRRDDGGYWYYCPNAKKYYPYVDTCSEEWVRVVPRSSTDD